MFFSRSCPLCVVVVFMLLFFVHCHSSCIAIFPTLLSFALLLSCYNSHAAPLAQFLSCYSSCIVPFALLFSHYNSYFVVVPLALLLLSHYFFTLLFFSCYCSLHIALFQSSHISCTCYPSLCYSSRVVVVVPFMQLFKYISNWAFIVTYCNKSPIGYIFDIHVKRKKNHPYNRNDPYSDF
jgi:hypothetical protein